MNEPDQHKHAQSNGHQHQNNEPVAHHHDHEFDPDKKPPYVTLFLLIAMVLIGLILVIYFRAW